jgi:hypothetical protein
MKQRIFQLFTLLSLVTLFASCDPQTEATYYLENNSSGTIYYYSPSSDKTDTVLSGKKVVIGNLSGVGSNGSKVSDAYYLFDSARIYNDTATCTLQLKNDNNWVSEQIKKWEFVHHFVVRDKDF